MSDDTPGTKRPLRDGIDTVKTQVNDAAHGALDHARDGLSHARDTVAGAYDSGRDIAADTLSSARERLLSMTGDAGGTLESSPLIAVAGGIALGVLVGALLPRSARETELYGALGEKINAAAREAAAAAKDAGREKLADMGLSRDHASDTVRNIIDAALAAATSAGSAAVESASARAKGGESR